MIFVSKPRFFGNFSKLLQSASDIDSNLGFAAVFYDFCLELTYNRRADEYIFLLFFP